VFAHVLAGCILFRCEAATAADLAGCCADIEERIAELETATGGKGGRNVDLTVYGQINQAIMGWDDGYKRNAYLVTNDASRTRFGFRGQSKLDSDLSASFLIEIGVRSLNSKRSDQLTTRSGLDIRRAWWGVTSKTLGTIQFGRAITALEEITEANLAGTNRAGKYSDVEDSGLGLLLRSKSTSSLSGVAWRRLLKHTGNQPGEGDVQSGIRYITPTFAGFFMSIAWGADDLWDASLEYEGQVSDFKVAARVGYGASTDGGEDASFECVATNLPAAPNDADCATLGGSLSVLHEPSGLYANMAGGWFKDRNVKYAPSFADVSPTTTSTFWAFETGIQRNWLDLGATTIFGQLYRMEGGANARLTVEADDAINLIGADAGFYASKVEMWGIGLTQDISGAETKLYALYRHYDASVTLAGSGQIEASEPLEDLHIVMGGALIRF